MGSPCSLVSPPLLHMLMLSDVMSGDERLGLNFDLKLTK